MANKITEKACQQFRDYLIQEERSAGTIEKYLRDVRAFSTWINGKSVTKNLAAEWKAELQDQGYAPVTINSMLAAINTFFGFMGWEDCRIKTLRLQKRLFRDPTRELTRDEYERLLRTAHGQGEERLALLMETICATGIRVSEVQYITVEAAQRGRADIALKGKIRTILLPNKLCKKLLKYSKNKKIASGKIFLTGNGNGLSRGQIWTEMKRLCRYAGVEESKVFPHNLRHLFAVVFYRVYKDIVRLADMLGHSSVETTRIYLLTTGEEQRIQLEQLGLLK